MTRGLERYRQFLLGNLFAAEDIGHFRAARRQVTTPLAMGEPFTNSSEYLTPIRNRLIDSLRVHLPAVSDPSMDRRSATLREFFGVRTARHGPGDVSSVGHAATLEVTNGTAELA